MIRIDHVSWKNVEWAVIRSTLENASSRVMSEIKWDLIVLVWIQCNEIPFPCLYINIYKTTLIYLAREPVLVVVEYLHWNLDLHQRRILLMEGSLRCRMNFQMNHWKILSSFCFYLHFGNPVFLSHPAIQTYYFNICSLKYILILGVLE